MHEHNRINGYFEGEDLTASSPEGGSPDFDFDSEPHEQDAGHIIHTIDPEAALRLPVHEAAKIFPIKQSDLDRLMKSIEQFGQQHPAVLLNGKVLDGNSRIRSCVRLGIPVRLVNYSLSDLNGLTPEQWVLHRNRSVTDGRRMTDAEYALIIAEVYGRDATERALQRKQGGVAVESELRGETSEVLGTIFNLSPNLMKQALKLFKAGHTDLLQMVKDKQLSLSKAVEILKLPKAKREAAMKDPKAPLPIASPTKAFARYKSSVKSLKKIYTQVSEIAHSKYFSVENRTAIEPTMLQIRDAVAVLDEVKLSGAQLESQA